MALLRSAIDGLEIDFGDLEGRLSEG